MRTASHTSDVIRPWPLIALAAWVLPGLGHVLTGHARRGVVIGLTLLLLFTGGLLIGGIDVVDRRRDTLWFAGQSLLGPIAFAADYVHQRLDETRLRQIQSFADDANLSHAGPETLDAMLDADLDLAYRTSIGKVNEIGTLYCTLAGVMNLLVILDAVGRATAAKACGLRPMSCEPEKT